MTDYEKATRWLRLMRNAAFKQEERDIIEYIEEVLRRDNDMRNS